MAREPDRSVYGLREHPGDLMHPGSGPAEGFALICTCGGRAPLFPGWFQAYAWCGEDDQTTCPECGRVWDIQLKVTVARRPFKPRTPQHRSED